MTLYGKKQGQASIDAINAAAKKRREAKAAAKAKADAANAPGVLDKISGWLGKDETTGQQLQKKCDGGIITSDEKKKAKLKALKALGNK